MNFNKITPINKIMYGYIGQAKAHGIIFKLKYHTFKRLIFKNCFYCNAEPSKIYKTIVYNGIDRKNITKGYVQKNTVTCCKTYSSMKVGLSRDKFLTQIQKIYDRP